MHQSALDKKCNPNNGLFTRFDELSYPFEPKCDETVAEDYALYQSDTIYCIQMWCSTQDGYLIKTNKVIKEESDCSKYQGNDHYYSKINDTVNCK